MVNNPKNGGKASFKFKERDSYNRINGKPSVSLSVTKRAGENLLRISDEIKNLLAESQPRYPAKTTYDLTFDESSQQK